MLDEAVYLSLKTGDSSGCILGLELSTLKPFITYRDCPTTGVFCLDNPLIPRSLLAHNPTEHAFFHFSLGKEKALQRFFGHSDITALSFGERWIVAGLGDGSLRIWDRGSGGLRVRVGAVHAGAVKHVCLSADQECIVTASREVILVHRFDDLLQGDNQHPLHRLDKHRRPITSLHLTLTQNLRARLWSACQDGELLVWDLVDGAILARFKFPGPITSLAVSLTETKAFAATPQGICIVDLSGEVDSSPALINLCNVERIALSMDETSLFALTTQLSIIDLNTLQVTKSITLQSLAQSFKEVTGILVGPKVTKPEAKEMPVLSRTIQENKSTKFKKKVELRKEEEEKVDWKVKCLELESLNKQLCDLIEGK